MLLQQAEGRLKVGGSSFRVLLPDPAEPAGMQAAGT
jgi:hypothetical protein